MSCITTNDIWRVQHSQAQAILQGEWPAARLQTKWGEEKKKKSSSYEKNKKTHTHFWNGFKASLSAQSRQRAESEPRSFEAQKAQHSCISPKNQRRNFEIQTQRKWRSGKLFWRAGGDDALVQIEQTRKTWRCACQPRSIPLRSVGHDGGKANACVFAKDGCTHNYPRHGELPSASAQTSLRQLLFHLRFVILILVSRGGVTPCYLAATILGLIFSPKLLH